MFGKQHGTHGNNQDKCTEEYGCLVITQQARVLFTANKSVHHEYAIINPYTKDECRDDNVDEIEPYIKNHHCPQHYKPTRQDWHKTEQGMLDIEMENMNGIELAKRIRKDHNRAEIIFITSHFEFVWEGYEVDALHYLTKPLSAEKLTQVLSKAADKLSVEQPSVVISCDGETLKLYESDILYAEAFLHYIVIHTKDNEYKIKEPISVFENKVSDDFYRIHRSYLVSLKYITRISRTSVTIGNSTLPLSRGKYDDINRAFIEHN